MVLIHNTLLHTVITPNVILDSYRLITSRTIDYSHVTHYLSNQPESIWYEGYIPVVFLCNFPIDMQLAASRIRSIETEANPHMTYQQQRLGQYDYYEVLSAFRKEIVLGRTEDAIFWLTVLLTYSQSGAKTAARQLWIIASEVVDDDACVLRAFAVFQLAGKVTETDHLYHLTAKMCRSRKWYETAEGTSVDYLWSKSLGDLKNNPKPIPSYARDEHTAHGARAKKAGRPVDNRFSGHDFGRQQTKWMYDRDGAVSPDEYPDPQFYAYWAQYQELLGEQDEPVQQPLLSEEKS